MPMVTTRIKEAVPIIMPSAVRVKRTLLLQNVSKEKLRISPKAIRGRSRSGMRAAAISVRCYVQGERGASARSGGHRITGKADQERPVVAQLRGAISTIVSKIRFGFG